MLKLIYIFGHALIAFSANVYFEYEIRCVTDFSIQETRNVLFQSQRRVHCLILKKGNE